ncbi:MAG: class I SAM-dependent methyltransferase [Candidatus Accumulibacter sp.]|nr:class I SAM-dependent methyltransferase [Accumulibacter sp.]
MVFEDPELERLMVNKDDVVNAYRYILGREPESDDVVMTHMSAASLEELRIRFLDSQEFSQKYSRSGAVDIEGFMLPQDMPPLSVDIEADPQQMQALLDRIKREWEEFGEKDPHWSVLTHASYKKKFISENKSGFFESGRFVANIVRAFSDRNGVPVENYRSCFELGCGVGRITLHLSQIFESVIGADISKFHLDVCREELRQNGVKNVSLNCITDVRQLMELPRFDFFVSMIVLQHNPPPVIKFILECILDKLNPGGAAVFQVPTYRRSYRFDLSEYIGCPSPLHMEMHVLPQSEIFSILNNSRCDLVEVREDGWADGRTPNSLSNTFFVIKK